MRLFVCSFLSALLIATPCLACDTVVRRVVVHEQPAVVVAETPVIATVVTPVVATVAVVTQVQAYGAAYVPYAGTPSYVAPPVPVAPAYQPGPAVAPCPCPQQMPAATLAPNDCAEILRQLKSMDARMAALEHRNGGLPPPVMPPSAPEAVPGPKVPAAFSTRCAACHTSGKLDASTTFALMTEAGALAPLTDRQTLAIARKVRAQKMPPPNNKAGVPALTEQEAVEILDWIETAGVATK